MHPAVLKMNPVQT